MGLASITVDRPGGPATFGIGELTNIRVTDYAVSTTIPFETALGGTVSTPAEPTALPGPGQRAALLEDNLLNTTINNPSVTTGLVFEFVDGGGAKTVVSNGPGVDLVVFEISPPAGVMPPSGGPTVLGGDPFRLSGVGGDADKSVEFFAEDYEQIGPNGTAANISFFGPAAGTTPVASLAEFESIDLVALGVFGLNLYAAGVDLSELGFAEGAEVEALVLNSIGETGFGADPSLIVGLPSGGDGDSAEVVPTPGAAVAGLLLLGGLISRRKTREPRP
ncbi:MAG: hypothetical protein AAF333_07945 [Planctomycetota bacterium]